MISSLIRDFRFSLRRLARRPFLTLGAVICLALGIGASTAVFTLVNGILLSDLPYAESERIVYVRGLNPAQGPQDVVLSMAEIEDLQRDARSLSHVTAAGARYMTLTGWGEPERYTAARVSPSFFRLVGASAALGQTFSPENEEPGKGNVVILSHELWTSRFGSDPSVVGEVLTLADEPFEVIGVMPGDFAFDYGGFSFSMWVPVVPETENQHRAYRALHAMGRIRPEFTPQQAQEEMALITQRFRRENPAHYPVEQWHLELSPVKEEMVGDIRLSLWVLSGIVGLLLLIACVNTANLLLAKGLERAPEVALRLALGSSRGELVRQFLIESLLLGLAAGLLGLLLAQAAVRGLVLLRPGGIPRLDDLSLDGRVLLFGLLISLAAGVLSGLVPALRTSRVNLQSTLKEGAAAAKGGARSHRLAGALVVAELALALLGLLGAGLMVRNFLALQDVDPKFEAANLLTFKIYMSPQKYPTDEARAQYTGRMLEELRTLPGATSATIASSLPFSAISILVESVLEGNVIGSGEAKPLVDWRIVSSGYFETLKIALVKGRTFTDSDREGGEYVAVVDEGLARRWWPDEDPLGKKVKVLTSRREESEEPWRRVVGVVARVRSLGLDAEVMDQIYTPNQQFPTSRFAAVGLRTAGEPLALARSAQEAVWKVDPSQPTEDVRAMEAVVAESLSSRRSYSLLMTLAAVISLVLAILGIYGVMAHSVALRTREIGIRKALGAQPSTVLKNLVVRGMTLAGLGVALGLALFSVFLLLWRQVIADLLVDIAPGDALTIATVTLTLLAVAAFATVLSARRALQVDPVIALRQE